MAVSYIRVQSLADLFAPAVRAYGNLAVIGPGDDRAPARVNQPIVVSTPGEAAARLGGTLAASIATAFGQSPGPSLVYGIRTDGARPDWRTALAAAEGLDAQFVVLANVPAGADAVRRDGAIGALADHVVQTSQTGEDGRERMGVAMLEAGRVGPAPIAHERMVFVAHKATGDAAAAVAGTIAGYEPHVSVLLKPVNLASEPFTASEITAINGAEGPTTPPAGAGVLWLTDPALIPGRGTYLGEAYTADPGGKKYIDIVRTIDDVSFRLKARLIKAIGSLRISRGGLRSLVAQMEAVLDPLVRGEVIEGYELAVPILALLDRDPAQRTPAERRQIDDAQSDRFVEVHASLDYAGAIHRLLLRLKFT